MSHILAGVFGHHSDYKKLESDLENSGFGTSDYIVYLNDGSGNSQYLASVTVNDLNQIDLARKLGLTPEQYAKEYAKTMETE